MKSFLRRLVNLMNMRVAIRYAGLLTPVPQISECSVYHCSLTMDNGMLAIIHVCTLVIN